MTDGACDYGNTDPKHKSGKHTHKSAPRIHLDAINDPAKVAKLWSDYPNANIGIVLEPSGRRIIAPDSPEWLARFQERGLPKTVTVQNSGGEGDQHCSYLLPEDWSIHRQCRTGEFDNITDGYGVMPPSMHKSGREYSYIVSPQDLGITHVSQLPEAPGWALEMLLEATERLEDEPDDPNEPPVNIDPLGLEYWCGDRKTLMSTGEVDRSATLYAIGIHLAKAGASKGLIAKALANHSGPARCHLTRTEPYCRWRQP